MQPTKQNSWVRFCGRREPFLCQSAEHEMIDRVLRRGCTGDFRNLWLHRRNQCPVFLVLRTFGDPASEHILLLCIQRLLR